MKSTRLVLLVSIATVQLLFDELPESIRKLVVDRDRVVYKNPES